MDRGRVKDQKRSIEVKPKTIDEENRTVQVVFATEQPVFRNSFSGSYWEKMLVNSDSINLTRLKSGQAPILNNHRAETLEDQIGVILDALVKDKQGVATLKFSKRKSVNDIWDDVKNGIIKGISVGYSIDEYEEHEQENDHPILVGKKWTPHEISLVCVPADPFCSIRSKKEYEGEKMDQENMSKTKKQEQGDSKVPTGKEANKNDFKASERVFE